MPQNRDERFGDVGDWIPGRMLPEPEVLDSRVVDLSTAFPFAEFTREGLIGTLSAFVIDPFENPGVKPHTFVTEATVTATETGETWDITTETDLEWTGMTPRGAPALKIPLDDLDFPDRGSLIVETQVLSYPSEIATEADIVYETTREAPVSLVPFDIDLSDILPFEAEQETVALGDTVERSVVVENKGDERDSVLATLTAIDPQGRRHLDEVNGHETITLDPGESSEATLSWTPHEDVPEGEYDLRREVWAETDLDERFVQLDEHTEQNALTVEKPDGTLAVSTVPPDASVVIDGEWFTERSIELPVGSYEVIAIHGMFGAETESVKIEEGQTARLEIDIVGDEPWIGDYTNERWIVTRDGLNRAERDWSRGEIDERLYYNVESAYESGEPLYEHRTTADDRSDRKGPKKK